MPDASEVLAPGGVMPDLPAGDSSAADDAATDMSAEVPHPSPRYPDGPGQRSQRELQRELALRALI